MNPLDAKVLEAVRVAVAAKFADIWKVVGEPDDRKVDRAIQRLRKRGEIKHVAGRWKIPDAKKGT